MAKAAESWSSPLELVGEQVNLGSGKFVRLLSSILWGFSADHPKRRGLWEPNCSVAGLVDASKDHMPLDFLMPSVPFTLPLRFTKQHFIPFQVEYTAYRDQKGRLISADNVKDTNEYHHERIPEEKLLKEDPSIRLSARAYQLSKSRGNVINPDDIVTEYGADSLRLYEMFMGPLRDVKTWNTRSIEGVYRFLGRTWRLIVGAPLTNGSYIDGTVTVDEEPSQEQLQALHRCINKVPEEIERTRFNTGISAMMEFINVANKWEKRPKSVMEAFVLLLSPFAPHMAEELWNRLGHTYSLAYEKWPEAKEKYLKDSLIVLPVQINGKTRGSIKVGEAATEDEAFRLATNEQKLSKYLVGKTIKRKVYVPSRILNIIL
ncbi:hypothetical protein AMTR_s00106p00043170 [Amborella trichopoda]|uniref:leucine--tRNA ligase n=1 Tax=Amborella trichopoda TaxID=13333 RepID=W1NZB5_AMBTC|nr:hypothetical protein AMTR_s00106p00043170 [Amborella trichopoda]